MFPPRCPSLSCPRLPLSLPPSPLPSPFCPALPSSPLHSQSNDSPPLPLWRFRRLPSSHPFKQLPQPRPPFSTPSPPCVCIFSPIFPSLALRTSPTLPRSATSHCTKVVIQNIPVSPRPSPTPCHGPHLTVKRTVIPPTTLSGTAPVACPHSMPLLLFNTSSLSYLPAAPLLLRIAPVQ
jgi:hypothetical protein